MTKAEIAARFIEVKEEMCDHFCKWPEWYLMNYEDSEEAHDTMVDEMCSECPLANFEIGGRK